MSFLGVFHVKNPPMDSRRESIPAFLQWRGMFPKSAEEVGDQGVFPPRLYADTLHEFYVSPPTKSNPYAFAMDDDVWPTHNESSVPASSLLYPDVVEHGIIFHEASLKLLSPFVDVEACRIDKHGLESESIDSYDDLVFYFETSKSCHATSSNWEDLDEDTFLSSGQTLIDGVDVDHGAEASIFFIQQEHLQSLSVSEEIMKCLLSQHKAFSQFSNIFTSFSIESLDFYEANSAFYASAMTKNPGEQSIDELCYVLKYVEHDIDSSSIVPWSVRQMAIYQNADSKTQHTDSIILRPSAELWRRKDELTGSLSACRQLSEHWTGLHMLVIGTLNRNWTLYLQSLDTGVERIHKVLYSTSPSDIGVGRLQEISKLTDLILKYIHLQNLNTQVLNSLREESRRPGGREEFDNKDFSCKYRSLEWAIESTLSETRMLCSHAELVLNRAKNVAALLRDMNTIQNNQIDQETTRATNETLRTLAQSSQILQDAAHQTNQTLQNLMQDSQRAQDTTNSTNQALQTLIRRNMQEQQSILRPIETSTASSAQKSSAETDSSTTKSISLILLLALPLTLAFVFFNLEFIHVTPTPNGLIIRIEEDLWFYFSFLLPVWVFVLAVWQVWEWRERRRQVKMEAEVDIKLE